MITRTEINQILRNENLVFKKIIRTSDRFVLVLGREKNKDTLLKILRNPRRIFAKVSLKKEAAALKFFNRFRDLKLKTPEILKTNFLGKYPYYKKEFIKGKTLESKEGYFFRKLRKEEIKNLCKTLLVLNRVETTSVKKNIPHLSNFNGRYFNTTIRLHAKEIKSFLKEKQRKQLFVLIKKAKKFLSSYNKTIVHGEIYPDNLIKDQSGRILLLDWENVGIGSLARDAASVYLRIKEKPLSRIFLKNLNLLKQKPFQLFFQLEIILQSIGGLNYFGRNKDRISKKERMRNQSYFLEKIKAAI